MKTDKRDILTSSLLDPGTMFRVTESSEDKKLTPNSLGFVSFVSGLDEVYQDVAVVHSTIIRHGKTGMPRVNYVGLSVPIFYFDNENFKKLLPKDRRCFAPIEADSEIRHVESMSMLEFCGWAHAWSQRLRRMSDMSNHSLWPEEKEHPLNIMRMLHKRFSDDPEYWMERYGGSSDFREEFVEAMRQMSSAMHRIHLQIGLDSIQAELNAAEFLLFTNKGEFIDKDAKDKTNTYKFTDDNALIERTIKFYSEALKSLQKLIKSKSSPK